MKMIKVLSWNIWQGVYLPEVKRFLKEVDADLIVLQEVPEDARHVIKDLANDLGFSYVTALDMNLPMKYVPEELRTKHVSLKYGNAILTRHQIVKGGSVLISKEDDRTIVTADIKIGESLLHVFGLHLKHTHQESSDLQNQQTDILLSMIPDNNAVVMGDFNALPSSYPIQKIGEVLQNTEIGQHEPTWSMYKNGCSFCLEGELKHKLDYIFVSKNLNVTSYEVGQSKGSDHLPVIAMITV